MNIDKPNFASVHPTFSISASAPGIHIYMCVLCIINIFVLQDLSIKNVYDSDEFEVTTHQTTYLLVYTVDPRLLEPLWSPPIVRVFR